MSAQALTAEATKRCNACGEEVDRSGYSSKQWKARQMRRCTACTNAGREMRADAVPAPPSQEAAAAATADASVAEAAQSASEQLKARALEEPAVHQGWMSAQKSWADLSSWASATWREALEQADARSSASARAPPPPSSSRHPEL